MTHRPNLERRIADYYATEVPSRAPERLLATALSTIETTPQRRVLVRVPWRFPTMNGFSKAAIAVVGVIAVAIVGIALYGPGEGIGGRPSPSPTRTSAGTITPTPSQALPTASAPGPTQASSRPFQPAFTYVFPTGPVFDYGQRTSTYFEFRVQEWADAGTPGGMIVQAIGGGRADPCDGTSAALPIAPDPLSTINYLKSIPQLTITNQRATSIGGLPAHEVTVVAAPDTPDCQDLWLWVEETESFGSIPSGLVLRMIAVDVLGDKLVFTIYGEPENDGWKALADQFLASIDFS